MQLEFLEKKEEQKKWWAHLVRQMDLPPDQPIDHCDPQFLSQLVATSGLFKDLSHTGDDYLHTICTTAAASLPEEIGAVGSRSSVLASAIFALEVAVRCERLLAQIPVRFRFGLACQLALEKSLANVEGLIKYATPEDSKRQHKLLEIVTQPLSQLVCQTQPTQKVA